MYILQSEGVISAELFESLIMCALKSCFVYYNTYLIPTLFCFCSFLFSLGFGLLGGKLI